MYQSHWGLRESPFGRGVDPRAFYQSPTHEEALARLHFLGRRASPFGAVDGPGRQRQVAGVAGLCGRAVWHPRAVAAARWPGSTWSAWSRPKCSLRWPSNWGAAWTGPSRRRWRGGPCRIGWPRRGMRNWPWSCSWTTQTRRTAVLPHLVRLAKSDESPESRLTLILAGRREGMGRLGAPLLDLAELRIDIQPWAPGDTQNFLARSLTQAGRSGRVFQEPAVARLHELSARHPARRSAVGRLGAGGRGRPTTARDRPRGDRCGLPGVEPGGAGRRG